MQNHRTGGNIVGGTGSNPNLTRNDRDLVLSYPLPTLPTGHSLTRASLAFEITAYRNNSGITSVHAHQSGAPASRLFVRIEVTVD